MSALLTALVLTVPSAAPEIDYFYATVDPFDTLWVDGHVVDEDLVTVTVDIEWLGTTYTVGVDEYGYFSWSKSLGPNDEGWVSAIAHDSEGLSSDKVEDLIIR